MGKKGIPYLTTVCFLLLVTGIAFVMIPPASADTSEQLGTYRFSFYLPGITGPFVDECSMELIETYDNLTTHYGKFTIITKQIQTDLRLEHETQGYFEIIDSVSYFDSSSFLRKSEHAYRLNVTGYENVYWSVQYEFGRYVVVRDTTTIYEENYEQRYYINGMLYEEVECKDLTMMDDPLNVTVPAGTFECASLRSYHYEAGEVLSYTYSWIDSEGSLIQQDQYDTNNTLTSSMVLLRRPGSALSLEDVGFLGYFALLGLGIVAIVYVLKKTIGENKLVRDKTRAI